jgi:hypothetical protein
MVNVVSRDALTDAHDPNTRSSQRSIRRAAQESKPRTAKDGPEMSSKHRCEARREKFQRQIADSDTSGPERQQRRKGATHRSIVNARALG